MPTRQQLESALINADKAGDTAAAQQLANALQGGQFDQESEDFAGAGILEPLAAIGSGLAGSVAGGLSGLGVGAATGDTDAAAGVAQDIQKDFTYIPKTEAGKKGLQTVGEFAKLLNMPIAGLSGLFELATGGSLDDAVAKIDRVKEKGIGGEAGGAVLEATGSPALATIADIGSQGLAEFATGGAALGVGQKAFGAGKKAVDIAGPQLKQLGKQGQELAATVSNIKTPARQEIARQLKTGEIDIDTAGFKLAQDGVTDPSKVQKILGLDLPKVVKDKPFAKANKQGFGEGFLEVVRKSASPKDKALLAKMTRVAEKGRKDPTFADDFRPADVAGGVVHDKIKEIKKINSLAGKQIGATKKALFGKKVDASDIGDKLLESFKELKIKVVDGNDKIGFGDAKLDFTDALISGAGRKRAIKDIFDRMKRNLDPDALSLHELKGFLDEVISYGKDVRGLGGNAERTLKNLRRDIKTKLDDNFPEYAEANKAYSDTISALDEIQRLAGRKTDLTSDNAGGQLANLARRITSNAQSRQQVKDSFKQIDKVLQDHSSFGGAKRIGGKGGDGKPNLNLLMKYANELDRVTGIKASTGHSASVEMGLRAASGQKGLKEQAADFLIEKAKGAQGITEQNAYKSMLEFLKAQEKK